MGLAFVQEAKQAGLVTLEGHRSVGGMRASIYNAMPEAGVDDALALAERLRAGMHAQPMLHRGLALTVTLSVGVSTILPEDPNFDAVLARADGALYAAKDAGRDRVCLAPLSG